MNEKYIRKLKKNSRKEALVELENVILKNKRLMLSILKGDIELPEVYSIKIIEHLKNEQINKKNEEFFIKEYFKRNNNECFTTEQNEIQKYNIKND